MADSKQGQVAIDGVAKSEQFGWVKQHMHLLALSLSFLLISAHQTVPATQPTTAPDQVIAFVANDRIERGQIESGPERYPHEHWHRFHGRVFGQLLHLYRQEHKIEATEEEIDDYLTAMNRFVESNRDVEVSRMDPKDPNIREIGRWWVLNWKTSKVLYEQYGGTVIWNQANPQEPVGAYRALFREHEARGTVTICDPTYRQRMRQWLETPERSFVIPSDEVEYSVPWWHRAQTRSRRDD